MSSYWNVYDLGLLTLFIISFYLDINFLVYISETYKCFSISKNDIFNELIHFIEIQINRIYLEACITAAVLIRLLRYLPHFSNLIANLLKVFYKSLRNSLGFLFLFFLIFMSFVISATFHYGDELYEVSSRTKTKWFHTFALTSYTLIRCTLGQFEYDRAYRVSPTWTPIFYMVYVCVVFFILLNLLVAVVNEAYVLGKLEQKQIEDDIQEEYIHGSNNERLNALRRSKRPILQAAFIQKMNRFLHIISTQSINRNDSVDLRIDTHDNDDISLDAKQTIIVEKLQKVLLDDGYNINVIEKFVQRLSVSNDYDDEIFLFEMEESQTIKILYDEFKIFNNQHEKLAQDWKKTAMAAREMIQINTVDLEQALTMGQHLDILDQRLKKIENLIPKALENIIELYVNHFSTD
ncbi:unnamed protein product [Rotaria magnacalcarata]|uniref:Polycystin cation channel PKD1/PKD2 domain-containing protein n=1 Tax=Rotaria magnacalcarata TaxID=392030 RepID=A0A816KRQ9_9BILA|nr:unnamed protein product [Rotaria magnacalcarata]